MPDSFRRSGRQRRSNFKYSLDPEELQNASSDSDDAERMRQLIDDGDDDFNQLQTRVDENERIFEISDEGTQNSDSMNEDSDGEIENPSLNSKSNNRSGTKFSRWKRKEQTKEEHSRGVSEQAAHIQGKESILKQLFGSDQQDWFDVLRSRDQWVAEPTLPKRQAVKGGMCHLFSHTKEKRTMEAGVGWDWYYQGSKKSFIDRQKVRNLTLNEGYDFIPRAEPRKFLMGPYGKQKEFNLSHGQSVYLDEAWKTDIEAQTEKGKSKGRDGWILNIGTPIICLDWVPNQDDIQYLAIASRPKPDSKMSKVSPAYTPLPPLPSCVQIWAFPPKQVSKYGFLDSNRPPKLRLVICTEWGDVKQLKWCPMPRIFRDDPNSLGLLAGIWTDGYIRILDVQMDKGLSYVKYDSAAFHARPPNTLCTCITWLSPTDIAVGCANGFLAIWNIADPPSKDLHPTPWLYISLHQSYILAVSSAYPAQPHLLATSSIDGYMRLTDLLSPSTDFVLSPRCRIASSALVFSEPLLSFVSTEENNFVRIYPLRCFHSTVSCARADAFPLCVAVGHFHPTLLVGCADGTLLATNPMRRVLYRKKPQYQQPVFRHEWTRTAGGLSRFTEGYKVVTVALQRTVTQVHDGVTSTIREDEEGITHLGWNPNLFCGGWVAVGMGSGLVRVQDLAI